MLLQVHDELVYEVKENIIPSVAPEIRNIMQKVIDPKKTHGILCTANMAAGNNWAETEEIL